MSSGSLLVERADLLLHDLRIVLVLLLDLLHLRRELLHGLHRLDLLDRQRVEQHLDEDRQQDDGHAVAAEACQIRHIIERLQDNVQEILDRFEYRSKETQYITS